MADLGWLLYDTASSVSGFALDDPAAFAGRMYRLMQTGLDLTSLDLEPEVEVPEEKEEESEESEDSEEDAAEEDAAAAAEETTEKKEEL